MAKNLNKNPQLSSSIPISTTRTIKPSSEFYSSFSEEDVLEIIQALEVRREFPLKYSYKGRGAKIWNSFYLKYIVPRWYRTSSLEIDLLKDNFECINDNLKAFETINIVDVGAGNSYPVKAFIHKLNQLGRVNKYIALDISEELLNLSRSNFKKWFPFIDFASDTIDIEKICIPTTFFENQKEFKTDDTAKIILHLGVTIGNHQNRAKVFKNFKDSMGQSDLLVFTNEIGSTSSWNGSIRGGLKYHAEQIFAWMKDKIGIRAEDCELVRKYDLARDSLVASIKFCQSYTINFNFKKIDKTVEISEGEEILIWRHHKHEIPELLQEIEQAGLQLVHYSTNKYSSHIMVICKAANN